MRALVSGASFAAGFALAFLGLAAPDLTLEVMAWAAPLVTVPSAALYALGALKWSFWPRWPAALAAGALISLAVWPLSWLMPKNPLVVILWGAFWLGACVFAPRVLRPRRAENLPA